MKKKSKALPEKSQFAKKKSRLGKLPIVI